MDATTPKLEVLPPGTKTLEAPQRDMQIGLLSTMLQENLIMCDKMVKIRNYGMARAQLRQALEKIDQLSVL
jgi:hypothetical protein